MRRVWLLVLLIVAANSASAQLPQAEISRSGVWLPFPSRTLDSIPDYTVNPANTNLSKYGGWKARRFDQGTGFFRVEKIDGRWWAIDPEGYLYLHMALNSVNRDHASPNEIYSMMRSNGFNGFGCWSDESIVKDSTVKNTTPMAYTPKLSFIGNYRNDRRPVHVPRIEMAVFDDDFETKAFEYAQYFKPYTNDPHVFGFMTDNELDFNSAGLAAHLAITNRPDKNYSTATNFLAARGKTTNTWDGTDHSAYMALMGERYYSVVHAAIRSVDTKHMIIGSRCHSAEKGTQAFMENAGKYVDVFSANHYNRWGLREVETKNMAEWSGRPLMFTEFYTMSSDGGMRTDVGAGWHGKTQNARGLFYQNFVSTFAESGHIVGFNWFKYGEGDNNTGVINSNGVLYAELLQYMKQMNTQIYDFIDYVDSRPAPGSTLLPEADANFKGGANEGSSSVLMVKGTSGSTWRQAYLRFNVASLDPNIKAAKICVYSTAGGSESGSFQAELVENDTWGETTITSGNHPPGSTVLNQWSDGGGDVTLDVTSVLTTAVNTDGKLSIRIISTTESGSIPSYGSREAIDPAARPKLFVWPKDPATVNLSNLSQTYNGAARPVTYSTSPTGLTVTVTYNGSASAPINAGSYAVTGTVLDANYAGWTNETLVVAKAAPTVTSWPTGATVPAGQPLSTATVTGGTASVPGIFTFDSPTTVYAGQGVYTAAVTFVANDSTNYNPASGGTVAVTVGAPNQPAVVNAGPDQTVALGGQTPWTPVELACAAWYDASTATINSGTVTVINAGSQGGSISGPAALAASGIGNLQAVNFNGASRHLTGNYSNTATTLTAFFVGKSLNATQAAYAGMMSVWANGQASDWNNVGSAVLFNQNNTTANSVQTYRNAALSSTTGTLTAGFLAGTVFDGTTNTAYINGTPANGAASSGNFNAGKVVLGARWQTSVFNTWWNGNFGEAIICNTNLIASDRQKIEGYLAHKWGMAASLPSNHPYKTVAPGAATANATLGGTVSDPESDPVTAAWTVESGPSAVTFANASVTNTTATFITNGVYTLRLTAHDGFGSSYDDVVITVVSNAVTVAGSVPYVWLATWTNDYETAVTNDWDGDGFTTIQEYWSGTDPMNSNSYFTIDSIHYDGSNVVLKWRHSHVDSAIPPICIQKRTNLISGVWEYEGEMQPLDGVNIWNSTNMASAFYRLCVTNVP